MPCAIYFCAQNGELKGLAEDVNGNTTHDREMIVVNNAMRLYIESLRSEENKKNLIKVFRHNLKKHKTDNWKIIEKTMKEIDAITPDENTRQELQDIYASAFPCCNTSNREKKRVKSFDDDELSGDIFFSKRRSLVPGKSEQYRTVLSYEAEDYKSCFLEDTMPSFHPIYIFYGDSVLEEIEGEDDSSTSNTTSDTEDSKTSSPDSVSDDTISDNRSEAYCVKTSIKTS